MRFEVFISGATWVGATRKSGKGTVAKLFFVGLLLTLGACTRTAQAPTPTPERADSPLAALAITQSKLLASDRASSDEFRYAVAIDGDTAVVGARSDDNARGTNAGAVYVFVRNASGWSQQAKLIASDGVSGDGFGDSVAVGSDIIVAGAPGDDSNAGAAYVFARSGATWNQQVKLTARDRGTGNLFGTSTG